MDPAEVRIRLAELIQLFEREDSKYTPPKSELARLKLLYSRESPKDAVRVWRRHLECVTKNNLRDISLEDIDELFKAQPFCVCAGKDLDGRQILWQRMKFMYPSKIPIGLAIKATWLAMDAALADSNYVPQALQRLDGHVRPVR